MVERGDALDNSGNILLRGLSLADRAMLAPHATEVELRGGAWLLRADGPLDAVYFPDAVTVSLEEAIAGERGIEVAIVGREGMLGWPALLGSRVSPHSALVQARGGRSLRISAAGLCAACSRSPTLNLALLRFVHLVMVQMARTIGSHLRHTLDRRVARWVLMRHDRLGGDVLLCRHDELAQCLGVRRASITDQLHRLEGERLVRCTRGRIVVRDRPALERFAGSAYGWAEDEYRSLIAPFGKSSAATRLH